MFVYKFSCLKLFVSKFHALTYIHDSNVLQNEYHILIKYVYLFSIILSYFTSKYFLQQKFQVLSLLLFFCFRQDRPTGPVDRHLHRTCTLVHVCRPTARVDRQSAGLLSDFLGRPPGRPLSETCVSLQRTVDRTGRPEPNGYCQQGRRPTGPVDRQACKMPTALSSLLQSEICFKICFWQTFFLSFW